MDWRTNSLDLHGIDQLRLTTQINSTVGQVFCDLRMFVLGLTRCTKFKVHCGRCLKDLLKNGFLEHQISEIANYILQQERYLAKCHSKMSTCLST